MATATHNTSTPTKPSRARAPSGFHPAPPAATAAAVPQRQTAETEQAATPENIALMEFESDGGAVWDRLGGSKAWMEEVGTHWPGLATSALLRRMGHDDVRAACAAEPDAFSKIVEDVNASIDFFRAMTAILECGQARLFAGLSYAVVQGSADLPTSEMTAPR